MSLRDYLADRKNILVLDGALGTELEVLGCDLNDPLWSGKVLLENPQLIGDVGDLYLQAGSRCLITASYQATPQTIVKHRGIPENEAIAAIERSVTLALESKARFLEEYAKKNKTERAPTIFVAGSVGPYGTFADPGSEYRGDYSLPKEEMKDFHRPRIAALLRAGVDVLAVETQPSAAEIDALLELLTTEFPDALAWFSFTMTPTAPHTCISDGTPLTKVVPALDASKQVIAIGINCVQLHDCEATLQHLSSLTSKPLVVYPNSGEIYDVSIKAWTPSPDPSQTLAECCERWIKAGARIIGGCCRTGFTDIQHLHEKLCKIGYKT